MACSGLCHTALNSVTLQWAVSMGVPRPFWEGCLLEQGPSSGLQNAQLLPLGAWQFAGPGWFNIEWDRALASGFAVCGALLDTWTTVAVD
jgi:hypothetical protein